MEGLFPDGDLNAVAALRGKAAEKGFEFEGEEFLADGGGEFGEEAAEGDDGLDGITGALVEGLGGAAEVVGGLVGLEDDLVGKVEEFGQGQGLEVVAGLEGVEVAGGRAGPARAEFGVAMSAAVGVTAHGPGATVGDLATGFGMVSGHGRILWVYCSTGVLWCLGGEGDLDRDRDAALRLVG